MTYPNPTNITGIVEMFRYTNTVSGGIFGSGILLSIYMIVLLYLKNKRGKLPSAMIAAGFITTMASIMFFFMGIVEPFHMFLCILMTAIAVIWQIMSSA